MISSRLRSQKLTTGEVSVRQRLVSSFMSPGVRLSNALLNMALKCGLSSVVAKPTCSGCVPTVLVIFNCLAKRRETRKRALASEQIAASALPLATISRAAGALSASTTVTFGWFCTINSRNTLPRTNATRRPAMSSRVCGASGALEVVSTKGVIRKGRLNVSLFSSAVLPVMPPSISALPDLTSATTPGTVCARTASNSMPVRTLRVANRSATRPLNSPCSSTNDSGIN